MRTITHAFNRIAAYWLISILTLACLLPIYAHAQNGAPSQTDPSYAALADLLENQQAREQLITQLRTMASTSGAAGDPGTAAEASSSSPASADTAAQSTATTATATGDQIATQAATSADSASASKAASASFPQRLASQVQAATAALMNDVADAAAVLRALASGDQIPGSPDRSGWVPAMQNLLIALASIFGAYWLFRMLASWGFARLNVWVERPAPNLSAARHTRFRLSVSSLSRKLLGSVAALGIDLAATLLAAATAYVILVGVNSHPSWTTRFAIQLITAFVMVEGVRALIRGVFATRYEQLRLLPMSSSTARYWNRYLAIVVGVTGYALLFAVPFIQALFPDSVGKLVGLLIMLCLYVYAVRVIWKNRREVSAGLKAKAASGNATLSGALLRVLARIWHFLCIAYLTVLFVVSQTDQQEALSFMAQATLQSLIAIALGLLVATPLSSFAARPIQLRSDLRSAFPHLETRLNSYVPAALRAARLLIGVTVALIVLDAWQAFDLIAWVRSDSGYATIAMIVHVAIILFIAALIWIVIASLIENRLSTPGKATEREKTLLMLFRSAAAVVIATMTVLIVLSQIGIDIGPLIAGAGVVGLAVGFGAQKLVQDVITGVFIQLENGMNQNDVVEVGGLFGTVEKITIRSVFLRTLDGGYHVIPFSTIDRVTNHMRDYGYHYGEYNIAHRESVDDAIAQLRLAFQTMMQDAQVAALVLEDISIPGVTALNERGFSVRVLIKTLPGSQWEVQRAFNGQVKRHFDAAGIEIPYPQAVVHFGRDKSGYAAPVDVKYVDTLKQVSGKTPAPGQTMQPGLQASN